MPLDRPHDSISRHADVNDDPVNVARRVNVGVRLELERQERERYEPTPSDLERRICQLEAGIAGIVRILAKAGLVDVDLVGAVHWAGTRVERADRS